jgi:hypothetical protein
MSRPRFDDDYDDRPRSRRRYEDEDDDRPSRKRSRSDDPRRRRKNNKKLPLIIGGAVAAVALIVVIIVLAVRGGKDEAKITLDNFERVKPGQTLEEVEQILGRGSSSSAGELESAYARAFDEMRGAIESTLAQSSAADQWHVWRGNDLTIFVGFGKGDSRTYRVAYTTWLKKNGSAWEAKIGVNLARGFENLDQVAEKRQAEKKIIDDPKWKKGDQVARLIVGEWRDESLQCWRFYANGAFEHFPEIVAPKGTYRISGPQKIELFHANFPDFNNQGATSHPYTLLVGDEEMMLVQEFGTAQSFIQGPFYRMRPYGGGLGQTKILDPLLKQLKSKVPEERQAALISMVPSLGASAAPIAPALIDMLKTGDIETQRAALAVMAELGPQCGRVLPTLIALLRDAKFTNAHAAICESLSKMGPHAREALPVLNEVLATAGIGTELYSWSWEAINKIQMRPPPR